MKKWFGRLVTMVVSASLVSGICGQVAYADAVSITENEGIASENTGQTVTELLVVSDEDGNVLSVEENSNDIPALGHPGYRTLVAQQQATYTDCITFVIPESDTWGFEQTFARGELFDEFQKARMDANNWWYYTNNLGDPLVKQTVTVTKEYVWDYNLEEVAMQRAIEQAYMYGHGRPDMVTSYEVYQDLNSPYWYAYNTNELTSAYGTSAKEIVDIYMEENDLCYAGQTHRVAILSDMYYRIGIGCVKTKGGMYITAVEIADDTDEEGNIIPLGEYTEPVDGYKEVTIKAAAGPVIHGFVEVERYFSGERVELEIGETYDLRDKYFGPNVNGIATVKGDSPCFESWSSEDESIATVKDGVITAVGEGYVGIIATGKYMDAVVGIDVKAPATQTPTTPTTPEQPGDSVTDGTENGSGNTETQPTTPQVTENQNQSNENNTTTPQELKSQKITVAKKFRKTLVVKKSSLKNKSKTYKLGVKVNDGGIHGRVTYKVSKYPKGGKKYISVSSKGKVTLKKGAKKGTYKIKITAAKAGGYKKTSKTVTIKVK